MARRAALKKGVTFLVVRHPFERLLSAYEVFLLRVPFNEFLHCCIKVVFVGITSFFWTRTNCPNWRREQNLAQLQITLIGVSTPLEPSSKEFFTGFRTQIVKCQGGGSGPRDSLHITLPPDTDWNQAAKELQASQSFAIFWSPLFLFNTNFIDDFDRTSKITLECEIWHTHLARNSKVKI